MNNKNSIFNIGYVEGYYGRLLSWNDRKRIVNKLSNRQMHNYLYAPKEDIKNRLKWRNSYCKSWAKSFKRFCYFSKKKNINVIAGVAPGLDFNYKDLDKKDTHHKSDIKLLLNKFKFLLECGASDIALLLDDIPNYFHNSKSHNKSEGQLHAELANEISLKFNRNIYFVPRIYANELIDDSPNYLNDLLFYLNKKTIIIYCGDNIVSQNIEPELFDFFSHKGFDKILVWDNYYSNDYCPRRLFIGPWYGREKIKNIIINPTGMIETDLLILDIIYFSSNFDDPYLAWEKVLKINHIPKQFLSVSMFFQSPHFNNKEIKFIYNISPEIYNDIEFLLWKWKTKISIEWYPYIITLKQDLLIDSDTLPDLRIIKTQLLPLAKKLLKK